MSNRCLSSLGFGLFLFIFFASPTIAEEQQDPAQLLIPLKQSLFQALMGAIPQGAEHALDVCNIEAALITSQAQSETLAVGRTSDRLRNPLNKAPGWVEPLLRYYLESGDQYSTSVDLGQGQIGYVEPIFTAAICTQCHGQSVSPAVAARLNDLYPHDQALGYSEGDFRGLFWLLVRSDQFSGEF